MAKRKVKIGGFQTKIWKACGEDRFRPVLECIYIHDGFVYATESHILIKQSLEHVHGFNKEERENLEGKMIHRNVLKYLDTCTFINFHSDHIEAINGPIVSKIEYSNDGTFPKAWEQFGSFESGDIKQIGLNTKYLNIINEVFSGRSPNVHLFFNSERRAIKVTSDNQTEENQVAILMPTLIN